jgi:pantetheine-phosphate adenylyltransferase
MTRAVIPGSFDPPTNGHLDVIGRAAALFDEVVVAILVNNAKPGLFTLPERQKLLAELTAELPGQDRARVRIETFTGLVVDFCAQQDAAVIVKGIRGPVDYEYEVSMAHLNQDLTGVETVFLPSNLRYAHVSSSRVKEIFGLGGDVSKFVAPVVVDALGGKFN